MRAVQMSSVRFNHDLPAWVCMFYVGAMIITHHPLQDASAGEANQVIQIAAARDGSADIVKQQQSSV